MTFRNFYGCPKTIQWYLVKPKINGYQPSCPLDISKIKGTIWSFWPTVLLQCRLSNPFDFFFWRQNSSLFTLALLFSVLNTCGIKVLCWDHRPTSYVNWTTHQPRVRLFSNFISRSKLISNIEDVTLVVLSPSHPTGILVLINVFVLQLMDCLRRRH